MGRLSWLAIRLVLRASPRLALGSVLLVAVQAALIPLELMLSKAVLDRAALDLGLARSPDPLASWLPLVAWIALAATTIAVGQIVQPFASGFQALAGDRLTGYVTGQLIRVANSWRGLARFEDPSLADDLQRARQHAARGGLDLMTDGMQTLVLAFTVTGLAGALVGLHPLAPVIIVLSTLPQMLRQWDYMHRTRSHLYVQTAESRRLQYSKEVLLAPQAAKDVRLYGLGPFFRRRYDESFERVVETLDRLRIRLSLRVGLAGILSALAVGGTYTYIVWRVSNGTLAIGAMALYGGAATLLQTRLLDLSLGVSFLPMTLGFLPSLFRVLEAPSDIPIPQYPLQAPRPIRRGITFEDVHFTYPGRSDPVLRGLSLSIRPGEGLALVGHNGAGKTTIVKLLLRMYDPTGGRITLDGVDLREYDLDDLRREVGVIFQDYVRYELTAGENIGLGQVERLNDPKRLLTAASRSGALGLIGELPEGLDTRLGREFGGRELSGGEWQKLALSRAFLRDCQLLVLDEPTAALDVQTEHDVYRRFHELTRNKTTLLISHRLSTARMADRIVYLQGGRAREAGSHEALMARSGEYARLYNLQAGQYTDASPDKVAS